jgi:hypothetical protein
MFPDRTSEIEWFRNQALGAWHAGDFDLARSSFSKYVESVKQQNTNMGGALEEMLREAKALYSQFVAQDPLYESVSTKVLSVITENPGILQTDLYKLMAEFPREVLSYVLYFAADHSRLVRTRKGRTYSLSLPEGEALVK